MASTEQTFAALAQADRADAYNDLQQANSIARSMVEEYGMHVPLGAVAVVAYFGVPALGVESPDALEEALRGAFAADGPTVIEARVRADHYRETVFD